MFLRSLLPTIYSVIVIIVVGDVGVKPTKPKYFVERGFPLFKGECELHLVPAWSRVNTVLSVKLE